MKVLLVGGSGAIGRRLAPMLAAAGHDVAVTTRSSRREDELRRAGAQPVVLDLLDGEAVASAVARLRPDVAIHQATALAGMTDPSAAEEAFELTNRLRTRGTDNLLAAVREGGVRRVVAQSYTGWPYGRESGPAMDEADPFAEQRQGQARARLAPEVRRLAGGLPHPRVATV